IISALEGAVAVAEESKLPLFTADTYSFSRGSIAALGFNYYDVGKQTGEIVVRVLKGENPGDIAKAMAEERADHRVGIDKREIGFSHQAQIDGKQ
ncbi:ABC transporter substrate binding protein, partial [Rhizobium ruizarguesonis]